MKALVAVKRVVDYNVKVRVKADGSGVDLANVKMSMNPFDEIAVEEAIRLKEKGIVTEVIVVSIGVKQSQETLRTALAMGADRAILIEATDNVQTDIEPLAVAKLLAAVVRDEAPGLVICGKQAIDNDMNATGQMLSALLGWSQGTFANKLNVADGSVEVIDPYTIRFKTKGPSPLLPNEIASVNIINRKFVEAPLVESKGIKIVRALNTPTANCGQTPQRDFDSIEVNACNTGYGASVIDVQEVN